MFIATCEIPDDVVIPECVLKSRHHPEIDTFTRDVPLGADAWISCLFAWPHLDPSWSTQLFLTLTVFGDDHILGDVKAASAEYCTAPGMLAVIDPMVKHWLIPPAHQTQRALDNKRVWVGLQWEVPRRKAKARARELVMELKGTWISDPDRRYRTWKP